MTLFVDPIIHWQKRGLKKKYKSSCHLISDKSEAELHEFAARIGLKREWFQGKKLRHYDITSESKRRRAIEAGAVPIGKKAFVRKAVEVAVADESVEYSIIK